MPIRLVQNQHEQEMFASTQAHDGLARIKWRCDNVLLSNVIVLIQRGLFMRESSSNNSTFGQKNLSLTTASNKKPISFMSCLSILYIVSI